MDIKQDRQDQFTILKITGDLDSRNLREFEDCLKSLFKSGEYQIIVDLNDVRYFDSSGNGGLIFGMQECKKNNGKLIVVSKNESVNEIIKSLKIHKVLNLCDDIDTALRIAKG